jgi:predicted molibdopterin-dependent oxidoreductase YjgC
VPDSPAVCPLCEASCGILVDTDGERVRGVRGDPDDPLSRGHICPKAAALADLHADPDRLRVPVVRATTLLRYPAAGEALARLAGRVTPEAMRRLNYVVDGESRAPAAVVREFLDALEGGV